MSKAIWALIIAAAALPAAALVGSEEAVKERRVVRVVSPAKVEFEAGEDFVFVGEDGETVRMGAFAFHRGGFIGVQLVDLTPELRAHFGVPEDVGVMISAVSDEGPAARAGVEVGDIITAVEGNEVHSSGELANQVRGKKEGEEVDLEVWRDDSTMTLTATIAERERPQIDVGQFLWKGGDEDLQHYEIHLDELPENVIRIDPHRWNEALGDLYTQFQSPEWIARIKAMAKERQSMEERIRELEARLEELEESLRKLDE